MANVNVLENTASSVKLSHSNNIFRLNISDSSEDIKKNGDSFTMRYFVNGTVAKIYDTGVMQTTYPNGSIYDSINMNTIQTW